MTQIRIERVKCDGCSSTVDVSDTTNWTTLNVRSFHAELRRMEQLRGGKPGRAVDLCAACAEHLRKRLLEIGVAL